MRVEVYDAAGKERVGFLEGVADLTKSRANTVSVQVRPARTSFDLGSYHATPHHEPAQYVALGIVLRRYRIDRFTVSRDPEDAKRMIASTIPSYAERYEDIQKDEYVYAWPVLTVTLEVAETVFDMDTFEADGKPCDAWAKEEAWWRKRDPMPKGGLGSYAKAVAGLGKAAEKLAPVMTEALKGFQSPAMMAELGRQMSAIYEAPPRLIPEGREPSRGFSWKTQTPISLAQPRGVAKITGA